MLHGVLDPQPGILAFAIFDDDKLLRQDTLAMHPRDASFVPVFVEKILAELKLKLTDVPRWSFGCGPGSFTFLRVVAALGAGWAALNPQIRFRCVPGSIAAAAALTPGEKEKVGILYDGRNKEMLCFAVQMINGQLIPTGEELILTAPAAQEYFRKNPMRLAAFPADAGVLTGYLAGNFPLKIISPDLAAIARYEGEFDNNADKMCYIRPAVTTA